jgi:hypothetical protein
MVAATRTPKATREAEQRDTWRPPSLLPVPLAQAGYKFRWIRTSSYGQQDLKNVSSRMREGWVPVKAEDHPELEIIGDKDTQFPGSVEVGGLLLCKSSVENVAARTRYYEQRAADQMETVENNYLRQNDPRMPLSRPERKTRTTFGGPKPDPTSNETPE